MSIDASTFTTDLVSPRATAEQRATRLSDVTFGSGFTEHMVTLRHTEEQGWGDGRLQPYQSLTLDPATVGLHYGQVIFEGLKAYRTEDGRVAAFRPHAHGDRFRASAARLLMPELPTDTFVHAVEELVRADADWVPQDPHRSLYLRPLMFASEASLALRPALEYSFLMLAFVTEQFFGSSRAIKVWISEEYVRAVTGGTGAAKYAGNYAASYAAQAQAAEHGCDQVVWLDAHEHCWVEELGGMNVFFVEGAGSSARLVTPPLTGTILSGVTRDSILTLAQGVGLAVEERPVSVTDWHEGCRTSHITEVFACGTAAQITAVGTAMSTAKTWQIGTGEPGPVTVMLSDALTQIERGGTPTPDGWMHYIYPESSSSVKGQ